MYWRADSELPSILVCWRLPAWLAAAGDSLVVAKGGRGGIGVMRPSKIDNQRQNARERKALVSSTLRTTMHMFPGFLTFWSPWNVFWRMAPEAEPGHGSHLHNRTDTLATVFDLSCRLHALVLPAPAGLM